jgi:hypothetical protein
MRAMCFADARIFLDNAKQHFSAKAPGYRAKASRITIAAITALFFLETP